MTSHMDLDLAIYVMTSHMEFGEIDLRRYNGPAPGLPFLHKKMQEKKKQDPKKMKDHKKYCN